MYFSIQNYHELLRQIRSHEFKIGIPSDSTSKVLLLRHDIDFDLGLSLLLAREEAIASIHTIYLPLVNSKFYDLKDAESKRILREILEIGHEVGLHYDSSLGDTVGFEKQISILEEIIQREVRFISHHNPTINGMHRVVTKGSIRDLNLDFPHCKAKYLSDSCLSPREDIFVALKRESLIQLLIHPEFWVLETQSPQEFGLELLKLKPENMQKDIVKNIELMEFTVRNRSILDTSRELNQ